MSGELQKLMGVSIGTNHLGNQVVVASNVFESNHGFNLMYVYCDIASYTAVDDTQAPLLRVCSVSGKHGEMCVRFLLIRITYLLVVESLKQ
jgi:hypothetical protein